MITWEDIHNLDPLHTQNLPTDIDIRGVAIDSRRIEPAMIFIARRGAETDGHRFIGEALQQGALAALVEKTWFATASPARDWPLIVVNDSDRALRQLAGLVRDKIHVPVLGITGSNGKTTTKEMLAQILAASYSPLATPGNYNNLWGLPLTILGARAEHDFWILEHGMNHPGEIRALCEISRPTAGLVTTIMEVHSRFFRSLDQIADTKFDLYRSLPGDGIAFLNMNDGYIKDFAPHTDRIVSYGIDVSADITASIQSLDDYSRVRLTIDGIGTLQLRVSGAFQATNALAAAAVGLTFGVAPAEIRERLEAFRAVPGRARILERNGKTIIDDSYNANPQSMKAALDILGAAPSDRRKVAVLGDMLELNSSRDQKHRDIGAYARSQGIDVVIGIGPLARFITDEAAKRQAVQTHHFENVARCLEALPEILKENDTLLIKGSHGIQLEKILEDL